MHIEDIRNGQISVQTGFWLQVSRYFVVQKHDCLRLFENYSAG